MVDFEVRNGGGGSAPQQSPRPLGAVRFASQHDSGPPPLGLPPGTLPEPCVYCGGLIQASIELCSGCEAARFIVRYAMVQTPDESSVGLLTLVSDGARVDGAAQILAGPELDGTRVSAPALGALPSSGAMQQPNGQQQVGEGKQ